MEYRDRCKLILYVLFLAAQVSCSSCSDRDQQTACQSQTVKWEILRGHLSYDSPIYMGHIDRLGQELADSPQTWRFAGQLISVGEAFAVLEWLRSELMLKFNGQRIEVPSAEIQAWSPLGQGFALLDCCVDIRMAKHQALKAKLWTQNGFPLLNRIRPALQRSERMGSLAAAWVAYALRRAFESANSIGDTIGMEVASSALGDLARMQRGLIAQLEVGGELPEVLNPYTIARSCKEAGMNASVLDGRRAREISESVHVWELSEEEFLSVALFYWSEGAATEVWEFERRVMEELHARLRDDGIQVETSSGYLEIVVAVELLGFERFGSAEFSYLHVGRGRRPIGND